MQIHSLTSLALAFSLVVGVGLTRAAADEDGDAVEQLQQKVEELQTKLAALEAKEAKEKKESTTNESSDAEADNGEEAELERLKREVKELESKVAELESKQDPPKKEAPPPGNSKGQHRDLTGKFLEKGSFDKSIDIPGTTLSFAFGGYAKVDYIQDFDAIGNRSQFQVATIPIEGTPESEMGGGTTLQARETRFNIDVRSPTPAGQFRAFFEGDFYGDGNAFRLRHGYGVLGHLLGGQTWTTFMDIDAVPETLDFEVPDASIFLRQAMIRWEQPVSETMRWGIAIENPSPEIENPSSLDGGARAAMPDIISRVKWAPESSRFLMLAGMVRQIRWDGGADVASPRSPGWGVNFSGSWRVVGNDAFLWQAVFGRGLGHYLEGYSGFDSDAVLTPDGELQLVPVQAYVLGYLHYWSSSLRTTLTFSYGRLDNEPAQSDDALKELRSPHVNLIWSPWRLVDIGGELMWGERVNKDDGRGTATRFQFSVKYKFN